jgi:hypothetical protein
VPEKILRHLFAAKDGFKKLIMRIGEGAHTTNISENGSQIFRVLSRNYCRSTPQKMSTFF